MLARRNVDGDQPFRVGHLDLGWSAVDGRPPAREVGSVQHHPPAPIARTAVELMVGAFLQPFDGYARVRSRHVDGWRLCAQHGRQRFGRDEGPLPDPSWYVLAGDGRPE